MSTQKNDPLRKKQKNLAVMLWGEKRKKNKAIHGGSIKWMNIIRCWAHQGFLYLDHTERFYRVIWELIPFGLLLMLLELFTAIPWWINIIISFIFSHTLNNIFNFNFWTSVTFFYPETENPGNEKTIAYLKSMQERMDGYDVVTGVMIYGSLSRGVWHVKSDLDIRILRRPGIINGFKAYMIVHCERVRAVFNRQPLDMYMADGIPFLNLMREDEFPIFLKTGDERLVKRYLSVEKADFSVIKHLNELSKESESKLKQL